MLKYSFYSIAKNISNSNASIGKTALSNHGSPMKKCNIVNSSNAAISVRKLEMNLDMLYLSALFDD